MDMRCTAVQQNESVFVGIAAPVQIVKLESLNLDVPMGRLRDRGSRLLLCHNLRFYSTRDAEHRFSCAPRRANNRSRTESAEEYLLMALRLENKNALITGGASGIGRATAIRFAEEGANVFVADRHLAAAEETAISVKTLGRKAVAYQVDTSDEAQVNAMVAQMVKDQIGRAHV